MLNYEVSTKLLEPLVPKGTELNLWNGKCYISIVGLLFKETKVKGIKVPFHINFEEVNLRFYVKQRSNDKIKKGTVFIKEIVPKPIIKFIANTLFNENYVSTKMNHELIEKSNQISIGYEWINKGSSQSFMVKAQNSLYKSKKDSLEEFITEHYWGFNQKKGKTLTYEIKHPKWDLYKVLNHEIKIDFESTYGKEFSFLTGKEPESIILAEGSEISVEYHSKIK